MGWWVGVCIYVYSCLLYTYLKRYLYVLYLHVLEKYLTRRSGKVGGFGPKLLNLLSVGEPSRTCLHFTPTSFYTMGSALLRCIHLFS